MHEQEKIVAVIEEQLSRLDAGVAALERVRKKLTQVRAAVLQAAISGKLVAGDHVSIQGVQGDGGARHAVAGA